MWWQARDKCPLWFGLRNQKLEKVKSSITMEYGECPINGTVDGARSTSETNNSLTERERKAETQNATKKNKINNLKEAARRGRNDERRRPRLWSGYIFGSNSGGSHGIFKWAVAGTRVNGCMQEHEETKRLKYESAGELED